MVRQQQTRARAWERTGATSACHFKTNWKSAVLNPRTYRARLDKFGSLGYKCILSNTNLHLGRYLPTDPPYFRTSDADALGVGCAHRGG